MEELSWQAAMVTIGGFFAEKGAAAVRAAAGALDGAADALQLGEQCSYVEDTVAAIRKYYPKRIKGQQQAFDAIVKAFQYWEMGRAGAGGSKTPLVLAITGPTGVGKTETAHVLGEALLARRSARGGGGGGAPQGLLVFRGEDFSDAAAMPISRYHTEIKSRLVAHLRHCGGNAVVLFDEVQKVVPGTLDVLMEAMTEHPQLTFFSNGKAVTVDCSKVIFLLVSDIGWERMVSRQLLYRTRSEVPAEELRREAKSALDAQWAHLRFGKVIDEVVPYLPMEAPQLREVLRLKLANLHRQFQGQFWLRLCVTPETEEHLVSHRFIEYKKYKTAASAEKGIEKEFAEYGARNIENAGPLKALKGALFRGAQPWQPDKVLVVGYTAQKDEAFFAWCNVNQANQQQGFIPECPAPQYLSIMLNSKKKCSVVWRGNLDDADDGAP